MKATIKTNKMNNPICYKTNKPCEYNMDWHCNTICWIQQQEQNAKNTNVPVIAYPVKEKPQIADFEYPNELNDDLQTTLANILCECNGTGAGAGDIFEYLKGRFILIRK